MQGFIEGNLKIPESSRGSIQPGKAALKKCFCDLFFASFGPKTQAIDLMHQP
jgi:hypothetical protein